MLFSELCTYCWQSCWLRMACEQRPKTEQMESVGFKLCMDMSYLTSHICLTFLLFSSWAHGQCASKSYLQLWTKCQICISFMAMKTFWPFLRQTLGLVLGFPTGPVDGCQGSWLSSFSSCFSTCSFRLLFRIFFYFLFFDAILLSVKGSLRVLVAFFFFFFALCFILHGFHLQLT